MSDGCDCISRVNEIGKIFGSQVLVAPKGFDPGIDEDAHHICTTTGDRLVAFHCPWCGRPYEGKRNAKWYAELAEDA